MTQNIELHIEELVLHGFRPGDRHRIGEALQLELEKLFLEQGVPELMSLDGEYTRTNAGSVQIRVGSNAEIVGREIAGSLYGSFQPAAGVRERR